MARREDELQQQQQWLAAEPWEKADRQPTVVRERVEQAKSDFWYFDQVYFPPEMYQDYHPPDQFHRTLYTISNTPGAHVVAGPRGFAKTKTIEKVMAWRYLAELLRIGATYSHTMPTSSNLLDNVRMLLEDNPRIVHDWGITFLEKNDEQFRFRSKRFRHTCYGGAFSEGRSVRGFTKGFARPTWVLADDVETEMSSLEDEQVQRRLKRLAETYSSLVKGVSTLIALGNNFDVRCYINVLEEEQKKGILAKGWKVYIFPAWGPGHGSLWASRFPATTEEELREQVEPRDERDWRGNYQQDPIEADGDIFPRLYYDTYTEVPNDTIGVGWCDPNLSLKGKGDTTALGLLLWSPATLKFYVVAPHCQSYNNSMTLLSDYMDALGWEFEYSIKRVRTRPTIVAAGFDGNVAQEAVWTNFVRNWCREHQRPYPRLQYRRYNVDLLTKNAQAAWAAGDILFPSGFTETEEGAKFMGQIFGFAGKRAGKKDDAADWLISAFELIHELKIGGRRPSTSTGQSGTSVVGDYYQF